MDPSRNPSQITFEQGQTHRRNGRLHLAVEFLKKALERSYGDWRIHLALGQACFDLGVELNGRSHFQEAVRLGHDAAADAELGPAYEAFADLGPRSDPSYWTEDKCRPWLEQALQLYEKGNDRRGAARCRLRLAQGAVPDPTEVLTQARALPPEEARQMLEISLRRHPHHPELAFRLAEACLAAGQDRQAAQSFLLVAVLEPWAGPACEAAADIYRRLALYPDDLATLYQRALQSYLAAGQGAAADRCRQKLGG